MEQVIARCTEKDPRRRASATWPISRMRSWPSAPDAERSADRATRILGRSLAPPPDKLAADAVASAGSPEAGAESEVRSQTAWGHTPAAGIPEAGGWPLTPLPACWAWPRSAPGRCLRGPARPAGGPMTASSPRAEPLSPVVSISAPVVLSPPPTDSVPDAPAPTVAPVTAGRRCPSFPACCRSPPHRRPSRPKPRNRQRPRRRHRPIRSTWASSRQHIDHWMLMIVTGGAQSVARVRTARRSVYDINESGIVMSERALVCSTNCR